MKIIGLIILTFVSCNYGMPQDDGPPAAFSKIKIAVDGFQSVGEALKEISSEEGLLKELVNTGKTSSFFKNLNAFTGILGNSFQGAKFFTDLAFGSFEARMFNRVFNEFENLNDEIKSMRAFAKRGFNQVIGSVWEAQRINPLAKLDSAIDNYKNYMVSNFLWIFLTLSHFECLVHTTLKYLICKRVTRLTIAMFSS